MEQKVESSLVEIRSYYPHRRAFDILVLRSLTLRKVKIFKGEIRIGRPSSLIRGHFGQTALRSDTTLPFQMLLPRKA